MKTYSIRFLIEDALAQSAVRRSVAGMEAIERAANKAAGAIQRAHTGGGGAPGAGGAAAGPTASAAAQAKALTDLDALQDRLILKDYKRRVAYEKQKIADAKASAAQMEQFATRGLLLAGAVALKGLDVMVAGYQKVREDAMAAAEATLTMRKNLRVEGALKGTGTPDEILRQGLEFRARTGLGEAEASEFTRQYLGTTPIAFEKGNITQKVSDELMLEAGKRAARQGGDVGTSAELAGLLGQFGAVPSTKAGLSQLESIRVGLVKGRGDDSPLTRQLLNVAGSLAGEGHAVPSLPEMAALIGVTSLSGGPGQAGDRANQLYRGLKIGLTKQTKVRGTDQAQGAYLKGLGVGEKDTLEQTLDKIVPDLQKAKDAGRDLDAYLASKNFRASEQRRAIIETFENYAPLKERMREAREAGLDETLGEGEIEKNKAFLTSPAGRYEQAKALQAVATATRGVEEERLKALMATAEASPAIQEGDKSWFTQVLDATYRKPVGGRMARIQDEAVRDLRARAIKAGVTEEELAPLDRRQERDRTFDPEYVNRVEGLIKQRGGSVDVDIKPALEKLTVAMDRLANLQEGKDNGKAPEALPVAPRGGNARP